MRLKSKHSDFGCRCMGNSPETNLSKFSRLTYASKLKHSRRKGYWEQGVFRVEVAFSGK